jgi:choline dehydrogenase
VTNRTKTYDYIIVGAGSAGCVLAARLTEDPRVRVLLLEAGGPATPRESKIPAAFSKLYKSAVDWNYSTEPEPYLNGRRLYWPRGKMLGGSSGINAMIYMRGNALDYDQWQSLGSAGWGYAEVLPYFKKSENQTRGASAFHGVGGPLDVTDLRHVNPLTRAFLSAAGEMGIASNTDFNAARQEGAGLYQVTQKKGKRHSAADAFLEPSVRNKNLSILTGAHATQLVIENGRALGIAYVRDGILEEARADGEVILCGGTVNSPQLLLLSGIGPPNELERAGISAVHNLPGVGKNLQDHVMVSVGYLCTKPVTLASAESLPNLMRYFLFKRGPLVSNVRRREYFCERRASRPNRTCSFCSVRHIT